MTANKHEIKQTVDKLNHRPRIVPGYLASNEVFFNSRTSLTVALQS
jgi:IS30 family transposase